MSLSYFQVTWQQIGSDVRESYIKNPNNKTMPEGVMQGLCEQVTDIKVSVW